MTAPTGDDALRALREALAEVLAGLPVRPDRCGAVDIQGAESLADALLPVVLRYGRARAAAVLRAAAQEQRNEAVNVPDTHEGTHADGHRCAAEFIDRRADALTRDPT